MMKGVRHSILLLLAAVVGQAEPSIELARFLIHSSESEVKAVATDAAGNTYVAGDLRGFDFPAVRPLQPDGGAFLFKIDASGEVVYATLLGTHVWSDRVGGICVDPDGNLALAASTTIDNRSAAFALKVAAGGDRILYTAWLSGLGSTEALSIACARDRSVLVAGTTGSPDFPVTIGALKWDATGQDGFITRIAPDGWITYSTLLGGVASDAVRSVQTAEDGRIVVLTETYSPDFPGLAGSVPARCVTAFYESGAMPFSRCMPARAVPGQIALGPRGNTWVTGSVASPLLPVTADAVQKTPAARAYYRSGVFSPGPPAADVRALRFTGAALLAATDEGMFKSGDGGASWRPVPVDGRAVRSLTVDGETVYTITDDNRIYRSGDAGENWVRIGVDLPPPWYGGAIAVDPQNPKRLFAGGAGVWRSEDGGQTWVRSQWDLPAQIASIAVDPHDSSIVYAGTYLWSIGRLPFGGVYRSTDGGRTFVGTPLLSTDARMLIADPRRPGLIYAAGNQSFLRSEDYGATWTQKTSHTADYPWDFGALALDPSDPDALFAVVRDGRVYRTVDRGESWTLVVAAKQLAFAEALAAGPDGTIHVGGVIPSDGFLMRLDEAGEIGYLTYFGGTYSDSATSIAVDPLLGAVVVGGLTSSADFPARDAVQPALAGRSSGFVAKFDESGALVWSTYLGGSMDERVNALSTGPEGRVDVGGWSWSPDFLTAAPGYSPRGFVVRIR